MPVTYSIEEWMHILDITIPWTLDEDSSYACMTEFIGILESIIDHESHSE
jgi:hypothetical protein